MGKFIIPQPIDSIISLKSDLLEEWKDIIKMKK